MYRRLFQNFLSEFPDVEGTIQNYDRALCVLALVLEKTAFEITPENFVRVPMVGGIFALSISRVVKETLMKSNYLRKKMFFRAKEQGKRRVLFCFKKIVRMKDIAPGLLS